MQNAETSYQETHATAKYFSSSEKLFQNLLLSLKTLSGENSSLDAIETCISDGLFTIGAGLMQEAVDIAASSKAVEPVIGSDGEERGYSRREPKSFITKYGKIIADRYRYEGKGCASIAPFDAHSNLPHMAYSYGVQKCIAREAALCSYEESIETVKNHIGVGVPKRQAEGIAQSVSSNADQYYKDTMLAISPEKTAEILVQSYDGKGIPMLQESLREETAAAQSKLPVDQLGKKFKRGLGKHKKRSAQVSAVYTVAPFQRSKEEIIAAIFSEKRYENKRPKPENKQVSASIAKPRKQVIEAGFLEAFKRDPKLTKKWVVLVDGDPGQIDIIENLSKNRSEPVTIVVDLLHVLSYLWKAGKKICKNTKEELHPWVKYYLRLLLEGKSHQVERQLCKLLNTLDLNTKSRKVVLKFMVYLKNHHKYLCYDKYINDGCPICTGVIEGACRYLVRDRMEKTGCRWSLSGAEAILYLRALVKNGDFDEYWEYHMAKEFEKNHQSRFKNGILPKMDKAIPGTELRLM